MLRTYDVGREITGKLRLLCRFDNLPMELWKFGGSELKTHLLEPFNTIIEKNQMPQEWETGLVINIRT